MRGKTGKREIVYELIKQGETNARIAAAVGLSSETVRQYRRDLKTEETTGQKSKEKMRAGFWKEWTEAVNLIRAHYGKEPFKVPQQ